VLPDQSTAEEDDYLISISYREFLSEHLNIQEPEINAIFEKLV